MNVAQTLRHDVPGEAVAVGKPAAGQLLAALRKLFPKLVDLGLRFATNEERDLPLSEVLGWPLGGDPSAR